MNRTIIETYDLDQIPVLTMAPEDAQHCPVIIYVHGFAGDRSQGLAVGYALARAGFFFLSFDAPMRGARCDERLDSLIEGRGEFVFPQESGLDIYYLVHEIVVQAAGEIDMFISHLEGNTRADTSRIGLSGFSLGGFTTFYAAATNPRIQAAVPIAGIPAFAARWSDVVLESSTYAQWSEAMTAASGKAARRQAYMEEIDPFDRLGSFPPRALLMISGNKDLDTPKKYSVDLYRTLKPLYAAYPERLRLSIHDGAGHEVTKRMIHETCDWFRRYLCD